MGQGDGAISQRIASLMADQGISQAELAKRTGMSTSGISRIVAGVRHPYGDTLAKLAAALNVSVGYLLTGATEGEIRGVEPDIANFFAHDWHRLDPEDKLVLRVLIQNLSARLRKRESQTA